MNSSAFHAAFDSLPRPAFLYDRESSFDGASWLLNPAAQALALEPDFLLDLVRDGHDRSICLSDGFYFLSVDTLEDGQQLLLLRPDTFAGDQTATISHQLRRSLSPAFYAVDTMSELDSVCQDPEARQELARVEHRLFQILRLATQLDWCQPHDPLLTRDDPVDLVKLLRDLVEEVRPACAECGVNISFSSERGRMPTIIDTYDLKYLLLSLLSNSLAFSSPPGQIYLTLKQQDKTAVISLRDSNDGTDPTLLSRFQWNSPGCLDPTRGLGLGLPVAKRIASLLGGTLMQTSSGDDGVGMALSIPLRDDVPGTLRSPAVDRSGGFPLSRILLSNALPFTAYLPDDETM